MPGFLKLCYNQLFDFAKTYLYPISSGKMFPLSQKTCSYHNNPGTKNRKRVVYFLIFVRTKFTKKVKMSSVHWCIYFHPEMCLLNFLFGHLQSLPWKRTNGYSPGRKIFAENLPCADNPDCRHKSAVFSERTNSLSGRFKKPNRFPGQILISKIKVSIQLTPKFDRDTIARNNMAIVFPG